MLHTVHLSAHGYEADILPERGANLAALTRPALGLSSVRTPASLDVVYNGESLFVGHSDPAAAQPHFRGAVHF